MFKKAMALLFIMLCFAIHTYAENEYDGYIFKYKDGVEPIALLSADDGLTECIDSELNIYKTNNEEIAKELDASPIIEYVEPDYRVYLTEYEVKDTYYYETNYDLNWPQKKINCKSAWDLGLFGQNVRIAVIDTGVVSDEDDILPINFSDIMPNIAKGYDYVSNTDKVTDVMGHGTAIAQIIASQNNNSYFIGVAPRSTIVPLKAFQTNYVYVSDIAPLVRAAVDEYNCDIINMSFTQGTKKSQTMESAINHAYNKGAILIAAAGNDGRDEVKGILTNYPAGYDNVISVGSVGKTNEYCEFSQRNESLFCCAPGEEIAAYYISGTAPEHSWKLSQIQGTSFSAPVVCGVAALIKGIKPDLNQAEFMEIIKNTAIDLGDEGRDVKYGYGLIDVELILNYMLKDTTTVVAPIYNDYTDTSITVTHYGENPQAYTSIWISDSSDGNKTESYTLEKGQSYSPKYNFDGAKLTHYLISSIKQLKPLAKPKSAYRIFE